MKSNHKNFVHLVGLYVQSGPKVGIQYIVYNYCIPTFGPLCTYNDAKFKNKMLNMTVTRNGLDTGGNACTYVCTLYSPAEYRFQHLNYLIPNNNLTSTNIFAHVIVTAKQLMVARTDSTVHRPVTHTSHNIRICRRPI